MSIGEEHENPGGDAQPKDVAADAAPAPSGSEHHHELPAEEVPGYDDLDPEGRAEGQAW